MTLDLSQTATMRAGDRWGELASDTTRMLFASAQVISRRTGSCSDLSIAPEELVLMGQEKFDAMVESMGVLFSGITILSLQVTTALLTQWSIAAEAMVELSVPRQSVSGSEACSSAIETLRNSALASSALSLFAADLSHKVFKPFHSRVMENAKRLSPDLISDEIRGRPLRVVR